MAPAPPPSFWRIVTRFDSTHLAPWLALRNAIGVGLALLSGVLLGNPSGGLLVATGALDAAFSDADDPYLQRGRRMLTATFFVALAVFAGRWCGDNHTAAITLEAACAFIAGMLLATGQAPGDIGVITLVTLIVFSAQPAPLGKAVTSGLLAFAGGLLQTLLSVALWTIQRYRPESRALGALYSDLGRVAATGAPATEAPPSTEPILAARAALAGLSPRGNVESERYLALFSQAERIRLAQRGERRRLEVEAWRDAMLAAAGTLNRLIGGAKVRVPLEPEVYDLIFTESEPDGLWKVTPDERLHTRRTLYQFAKRNVRQPLLEAFDQPDGMLSCSRRETRQTMQGCLLANLS
jgi:hypothetical protein